MRAIIGFFIVVLGAVLKWGGFIYWAVMVAQTVLGQLTFWQGVALPTLYLLGAWVVYLRVAILSGCVNVNFKINL